MPFQSIFYPSFQIALLKALGVRAGFEVENFHLYLDLAAILPRVFNSSILRRSRMTAEWLFSVAAFGPGEHSDEDFLNRFPDQQEWMQQTGKDFKYFTNLRNNVFPEWTERWATSIDWSRYGLVGFTSMFQQNVASLALARRIKERHPSVKIIFGGANMEAEMGVAFIRSFPFIDFVATGEADLLFPSLLQSLQENRPVENLPGLLYRNENEIVCQNMRPESLLDLDSLPLPDFADYFHALRKSGLNLPLEKIQMPFETSRGCWWGEKHHCTFCGLNGLSMSFRSKSPERALEEVQSLHQRYGVSSFQATDNIVDMHYLESFFHQIEIHKLPVSFFYQTKANLTKQQIEMFRRGGVTHLQPGIESLSTRVLALMRKGCSMLQNVLTLKWSRVYDIRISWNLLYGFPQEKREDYVQQYEALKLITHLQPPFSFGRIRLDRFSPNFFDQDRFGFHEVRPESSYSYVYPPHLDLQQAAYYFEYSSVGMLEEDLKEIAELIRTWQTRWSSLKRDTLHYRWDQDEIVLEDGRRSCATPFMTFTEPALYRFSGDAAAIYEYCSDAIHNFHQIQSHTGLEETALRPILDTFVRSGMMLTEDDKFLSLALPMNATENLYNNRIPFANEQMENTHPEA